MLPTLPLLKVTGNIQMQSALQPIMSNPSTRQLRAGGGRTEPTRKEWVQRCAARLGELRPEHDWALITALAKSMWPDVGGFDPHIAAELEHESWL